MSQNCGFSEGESSGEFEHQGQKLCPPKCGTWSWLQEVGTWWSGVDEKKTEAWSGVWGQAKMFHFYLCHLITAGRGNILTTTPNGMSSIDMKG